MTAPVVEPLSGTEEWSGFRGLRWRDEIDVRGFVQDNYTPYEGNADFLVGPTTRLWDTLRALFTEERRHGILAADVSTPSSVTSGSSNASAAPRIACMRALPTPRCW